MKKILVAVLSLVLMLCCFTACKTTDSASDWEYVKNKGILIIGMTLFEPMDYKDESGELVGFEVEFGKAVCEKLGITAKFQEINWKTKESELNAKTIDCIWNGMTIDEDRKQNMSISIPYMANKQVICVKSENVAKYSTADGMKDAVVVAEAGSAGETVATTEDIFAQAKFTGVDTMAKAIQEVSAGTADVCVIDYVTSIGMIGEGTDFAGLSMISSIEFMPEEYGIACRKGSDMTAKINEAIKAVAEDGTLQKIAEKYKLQDQLIVKAN